MILQLCRNDIEVGVGEVDGWDHGPRSKFFLSVGFTGAVR